MSQEAVGAAYLLRLRKQYSESSRLSRSRLRVDRLTQEKTGEG